MALHNEYILLNQRTDEFIDKTYLNILTSGDIWLLKSFRNELIDIINPILNYEDLPDWFINSIKNVLEFFHQLFPGHNEPAEKVDVLQVWDGLRDNAPSGYNRNGKYYPIPFLQSFANTITVKHQLKQLDNLEDNYREKFNSQLEPVDKALLEFQNATLKLNQTQATAEDALSKLNKEVGKIGVKLYADIFDKQALEHSRLFMGKVEEDGKKVGGGLGKAQWWMLITLVVVFSLVIVCFNLDSIFPLGEETAYTPTVLVHLLGRVLSISLFIFFVSFSVKQYRINMHLYTLNKHRANTLKSFEYLTSAPDKLEPASYNAILMKVAESIYESGQTGYVSSSETHSDMPSIIDMTKIISPSSKA